jgi:RimJ/RimL family protein N-acetyltransferase
MVRVRVTDRVELDFEAFVDNDVRALASWLTSEPWPFHGLRQEWTESDVEGAVAAGEFTGSNRSFWVCTGHERAGLLRFRYLDEASPDVDLRVLTRFRGRGIGTAMLEWAPEHIFSQTDTQRLSGETRIDNAPMRRIFERCAWTQEAHYRMSWPDGKGGWIDSVGYAILRNEWEARAPR